MSTGKATGKVTPLRRKRACPECGKPSSHKDYPFCSTRCKVLDLGRWLSGRYAIPVAEADDGGTSDDDSDAEGEPLREQQ
jgi:uncharacterized protein